MTNGSAGYSPKIDAMHFYMLTLFFLPGNFFNDNFRNFINALHLQEDKYPHDLEKINERK